MTAPYEFNYERMVQDLMLTCPWLVSVLMRVPGVRIDDTPMANEFPWMATDGMVSYYHQGRMSKETMQFGALGIIHEDVHVLLGHPFANRTEMVNLVDMDIWDYACENVCNYWVKTFGIKVDPRVVYDEKWDGLTEWQIYNELMKDQNKDEKQKVKNQMQQASGSASQKAGGQSSPSNGQGGPSKGLPQHQKWGKATPEQVAQAKHESAANLAKIAIDMQKSGRGDAAAKIQLLVKAILDDTNWEDILYKYLEYHQIQDYSYSRPDKRTQVGGIIMPSLLDIDYDKGKLRKAKAAFDTSGSTTGRPQQRCLGGLKKIFEELGGYECSIIYADAEVHKVVPLEEWEQHMPEGGGGTKFEPVFEYVEKEWDNDISVLIFFTDGDGTFPHIQPPYDVIWVDFGSGGPGRYPFGEVIPFKM